MRSLVLLLLLANLLFAAWAHWVAPPRGAGGGRVTPSAGDSGAIRLLREAAPSAGTGDTGGPSEFAAADCVTAGPYYERLQATEVEDRLVRLGFAVRLRTARENVRSGDWVRVEDLATPEDATNALAQLRDAGVPDAYLLTEEAPGTVISLGVFSDPGRAAEAEALARRAGFEPRTVARVRESDVFWLDIDRLASAGLPTPEQLAIAGAADVALRRCPVVEPEAATPDP